MTKIALKEMSDVASLRFVKLLKIRIVSRILIFWANFLDLYLDLFGEKLIVIRLD